MGKLEQEFRTRRPQHFTVPLLQVAKGSPSLLRSSREVPRILTRDPYLFSLTQEQIGTCMCGLTSSWHGRMAGAGKDRLMVTMQVWMSTWYCPGFYIWSMKSMGS